MHPKTSLDGPRLSLSDSRKGSLKSLHESSKAPWFANAARRIGNKDSRSVRSPLGASNLSQQSGELIPMSGELLLPHARSDELCRSDGTLLERKMNSKLGDTRVTKSEDAASKQERAVNAVIVGRLSEGSNAARARAEEIRNANLEYLTKGIESVFDNISASRNSFVKTMIASTCEPGRSSLAHEKVDEAPELAPSKGEETVLEDTSREALQPSLQLTLRPSSEQGDDSSPYEALRQRYIQKAESEVWDGDFYVIQRRPPISPASRAQSFISNSDADSSSESCLLDVKSPHNSEVNQLHEDCSRRFTPRFTSHPHRVLLRRERNHLAEISMSHLLQGVFCVA